MIDRTPSQLGRSSASEDSRSVRARLASRIRRYGPHTSPTFTDDAVDRITADAIRLEAAFQAESSTTGTAVDDESGDEPAETEAANVDRAPGESVTSNPTEPKSDVDGTDGGSETTAL